MENGKWEIISDENKKENGFYFPRIIIRGLKSIQKGALLSAYKLSSLIFIRLTSKKMAQKNGKY